jgi:hypothetical protein
MIFFIKNTKIRITIILSLKDAAAAGKLRRQISILFKREITIIFLWKIFDNNLEFLHVGALSCKYYCEVKIFLNDRIKRLVKR